MKCKRRKAVFGLDDAIMLIGTAITAGTQINNAIQNKKNLQAQQRAANMANIDEQNSLLQQNLGTLANNRDYIDDRQNQIVLKTRNDNQLKYGGDDDKYAARDNTRTQFVPGTGYVPNAKLNKNTGKNVQYDSGPLGFVPIVGDILQGGQAVSDFKNKNYKRAALNAGLLFLPNTLERLGKPVVKSVAKAFSDKFSYLKKINPYLDDNTIKDIMKYEDNVVEPAMKELDDIYKSVPNLHRYTRDELSEMEEYITKNRATAMDLAKHNDFSLMDELAEKERILEASDRATRINNTLHYLGEKYAPPYNYRDPFDIEPEFAMGGYRDRFKACYGMRKRR